MPNPKDSLKSTWYTGDRSNWGVHQWIIHLLNAYPVNPDLDTPIFQKTDKIPYTSQRTQHKWILFHAFLALLVHQAMVSIPISVPFLDAHFLTLSRVGAFLFYYTAFNWIVIREVKLLRKTGEKIGFLDGDEHERDGVPDIGVGKVAGALFKTTGSRLIMAIYLTYDPGVSPLQALSDLRWWGWLALEIGLYGIVLDFWFYIYHRAMHDIDGLWKYHRTHHLTKHPNALLSAYADHEQEFFDMVVVPFLTYLTLKSIGLPMGFYDWWVCHQYIAFIEVAGHSGLRMYVTAPSTMNWFLKIFDAEIVVEDHDLHHRKGYRKTHNYGKQTRLWDRLFGTCGERIETKPDNIDYVNQVRMPLW